MDYILWKADSVMISYGSFHLYWYAIILIISYLVSLTWLRKKLDLHSGMKVELIVFISFLLAFSFGRLGYGLTFPGQDVGGMISKIFPIYFKSGIHFLGLPKLMLPIGLLGLLFSFWLCKQLFLKNISLKSLLDITLPLASLTAGLFFLGNFLNGDIVGKPTDSGDGVVHMGPIVNGLKELKCCIMRNPDGPNPLKSIKVIKEESKQLKGVGHKNININALFKAEIEERNATEFIIGDVKTYLFEHPKFVSESGSEPIKHALTKMPEGNISAVITTIGIARYPVRFYLFVFCFILFFISNFFLKRKKYPPGRIAGMLLMLFSAVFLLLEFLTEQTELAKPMHGLYLNQWFLLPSFLIGLALIVISFNKPKKG